MGRELAENLETLWEVLSGRSRLTAFEAELPRFIVWQRRRLFGIIPYRAFAGYVILFDFGEYWRAMRIDARRRDGPIIGADFRKNDAARLDAWKWISDSRRWIPIWGEQEESEAFEQIEDSVKNAVLNLPASQV